MTTVDESMYYTCVHLRKYLVIHCFIEIVYFWLWTKVHIDHVQYFHRSGPFACYVLEHNWPTSIRLKTCYRIELDFFSLVCIMVVQHLRHTVYKTSIWTNKTVKKKNLSIIYVSYHLLNHSYNMDQCFSLSLGQEKLITTVCISIFIPMLHTNKRVISWCILKEM